MTLANRKADIEKKLAQGRDQLAQLQQQQVQITAIINALEGQLILIRDLEKPAEDARPTTRAERRRLKAAV